MTPRPTDHQLLVSCIAALIVFINLSVTEARTQSLSGQAPAASRLERSKKDVNAEARRLLDEGLQLADRKDWVKALAAFNQAVTINPRYGDAYVAMADTYMNMGKYEDAFKVYRQAISVEPSNPLAHYSLGAAYNSMAQYGDAFRPLVQAVQLDPKFAEAHYEIGYAYLQIDRPRDALNYLRRAAQLWPTSADIHLAMGQAYIGVRDLKSAEKELKILAALDASAAADLQKDLNAMGDIAVAPTREVVKASPRTEQTAISEGEQTAAEKSGAQRTARKSKIVRPVTPPAEIQSTIPTTGSMLKRSPVQGSDASVAIELSFWESVKNSNNPEEFSAYLNKYPEGQFAELAGIRLRSLTGKSSVPVESSAPKQPQTTSEAVPSESTPKPPSQLATENGIAQPPKEQASKQLPAEAQPAKEQSLPATSLETGSTANVPTIESTLVLLRGLLQSKFSYQLRTAAETGQTEVSTVEVKVDYEPLPFAGCTLRWRDQADILSIALSDVDPNAVSAIRRSRANTVFSIEVWDVSISTIGGKDAINEIKGDGTVNRYNSLDLQYDGREKAEKMADGLRQAIRACGVKPAQ